MRVQQNKKSVQLTRQVFVHNMWSGMLIIAGSEKERVQARLSPCLSLIFTPQKTEIGSKVKAIGSCLRQESSDWFLRPYTQISSLHTPCYISPQLLLLSLSLHIPHSHDLVLNPLFFWHIDFERLVNCHLHKWKMGENQKTKNNNKTGCTAGEVVTWALNMSQAEAVTGLRCRSKGVCIQKEIWVTICQCHIQYRGWSNWDKEVLYLNCTYRIRIFLWVHKKKWRRNISQCQGTHKHTPSV